MNKYTINNVDYYLADDVYKTEPESFVGCSKTSRLIIKNKKLKQNEYIYMKYIKSSNEWRASDETYKTAKVFITCEWTHNNLIKFKKTEQKTKEDIMVESMKAPPILELKEEEKFTDINGNKLEIEIRGTREINGIYFKVKDVADKFGLGDVSHTLLQKNTSFVINLHYKLFKIHKVINYQNETNKNVKYLFLTFKGLTKLLYVSQSKNAEHFQDWANNILFINQFGTKKEKQELASNLLGVNINVVKQIFNKNVSTIPCIYLLSLNTVKDLRETLNIPTEYNDEMIVCKYGCTEDIERRIKEHQNNYGKLNKVNLELVLFSYIDPKYIFDTENSISNYFHKYKLNKDEEIIIIQNKDMKNIKGQYDMVQQAFSGHIKELINKIKLLENKLNEEQLKYKLQITEYQLKYQLELKNKERENIELKHQLELINNENMYIKKELEFMSRINELQK